MPTTLPTLPPDTPPALREALAEARARLEALYGERLCRVILYGSRARGDARPDSDVDLLVVLDEVPNTYLETKRAMSFWGPFLTRYGLSLSIKPYAEAEYLVEGSPFLQTVRTQGIEL